MLKIVIALVLFAHGVGHIMGMLQVFRIATVNPEWHGDSWLLSGTFGPTVVHAVAIVLWAAAMIGFIALAAVVLGWLPAAWFSSLAVSSAIASLAALLVFPTAFPSFSTIGALVVDVAVLLAVFWLDWSPSDVTA